MTDPPTHHVNTVLYSFYRPILILVLAVSTGSAQQTLSISGQVVMEDGSPPPGFASIERHCGGQKFVETQTDPKGRFTFTVVGSHDSAVIDASESRSRPGGGVRPGFARGTWDLSGCDVRAVLAGFRSSQYKLGMRSIFDSPDIGLIHLRPITQAETARVSITSLNAPPKARKAFDQAVKELAGKNANLPKAIVRLEKAVAAHLTYAAAWTLLGETRLRMKNSDDAGEAFRRAIDADANYLPPYLPLMRLEMSQGRWKSVASLSSHALKLDPHTTEAEFHYAVASMYLGETAKAKKLAVSVQLGSRAAAFPLTHHLLGVIYAQEGNAAQAADEFRAFVRLQPDSPVAEDVRKQLADWVSRGLVKDTAP